MLELKFHEKFFHMINNGRKIQTTRTHLKQGCDVDEDIIARFVNDNDEFTGQKLLLHVSEITKKQFKSLDDIDAIREDVITVRKLQNDLLNFYPDLNDYSKIYCIRFDKLLY